jgi:hypothetical protein
VIWRNLHPICNPCWDNVVGVERWKIRDLHHFFTFDAHPECCWCGSPTHGQWWKAPRMDVPCQGLFGFHGTQSVVIDLDEMKTKYRDTDSEVIDLINIARGLQKELDELEQQRKNQL